MMACNSPARSLLRWSMSAPRSSITTVAVPSSVARSFTAMMLFLDFEVGAMRHVAAGCCATFLLANDRPPAARLSAANSSDETDSRPARGGRPPETAENPVNCGRFREACPGSYSRQPELRSRPRRDFRRFCQLASCIEAEQDGCSTTIRETRPRLLLQVFHAVFCEGNPVREMLTVVYSKKHTQVTGNCTNDEQLGLDSLSSRPRRRAASLALPSQQEFFSCAASGDRRGGGEVTLRGQVKSFYTRQVFVQGCRRVPGVTMVVDELRVEA